MSNIPTLDEIAEIVRQVLSEMKFVPLDEVTLESHLYLDLDIDSMDLLDLVIRLEKKLETSISGESVNEMCSFLAPPRTQWRFYRTVINRFMRHILDKLGFSYLVFRREHQIFEFSKKYGVAPFSVGLLCVCIQHLLEKFSV